MSKNNVIQLGGMTKLDIPPDRVLEGAKGKLDEVVVMGFNTEGNFYVASSTSDGGAVLWLVELLKKALMESNRLC